MKLDLINANCGEDTIIRVSFHFFVSKSFIIPVLDRYQRI